MKDPYSTAPLDLKCREIRLVKIFRKEESDVIKCDFQCFPLEGDRPEFIALSYTWGKDVPYKNIEINGSHLPVRENLWRFLRRAQQANDFGFFWIDAICIDQSNSRERNHQVDMMRDIYSNARSVTVWLGEESNDSDKAMDYFSGAGELDHLKKWSPELASPISHLCERSYWRRIWIIQEIFLARQATVCCGSKRVPWYILERAILELLAFFERAMNALQASLHEKLLRVSRKGPSFVTSPAVKIVKMKSAWDWKPQPLSNLMELYCDHEATDLRDKVYALLSLATATDMVVDYDMPTHILFREVLRHTVSSWKDAEEKPTWAAQVHTGKRLAIALEVRLSERHIESEIRRLTPVTEAASEKPPSFIRLMISWW
jgi:hypothetical protein